MHRISKDIADVLKKNEGVYALWLSLRPLSRNEWICWVLDAKKKETRERRIMRLCSDLLKGKRRPCCFPGCVHRR